MYIEYGTLEQAKQNAEQALKEVQDIKDIKSQEWREAWDKYKRLASDYRSFLIVHYNL